jgi:hypothetical protein
LFTQITENNLKKKSKKYTDGAWSINKKEFKY